ncbi:MAG: hypothetical protein Nk1A_8220 [Endomicrobiia bacterium]|nr:MAG: hypothetical protein Nk1A_8220 [Endomicrobiia bacterium]
MGKCIYTLKDNNQELMFSNEKELDEYLKAGKLSGI